MACPNRVAAVSVRAMLPVLPSRDGSPAQPAASHAITAAASRRRKDPARGAALNTAPEDRTAEAADRVSVAQHLHEQLALVPVHAVQALLRGVDRGEVGPRE